MKTYKLLTFAASVLLVSSCTELSSPLEDVNITARADEDVAVENNVVTVQRNTPVRFDIVGEPDNITFYSGEIDHNYDYRNRTLIDPSQIKSSVMSFSIQHQYSEERAHQGLYNIYMSETFSGLNKDDFEADCALLAEFADWHDLIPQENLPQKAKEEKSYEVDMMPYLGKNFTFAVSYHPKEENADIVQPRVNFKTFKIVNTLYNGSIIELMPSAFGLTPVNVWSANYGNGVEADETNLKKNNGYYDGEGKLIVSALWYGTTTNNCWGMWNLSGADQGNFNVHSTEKNKGLHPSWLVSDYIVINECVPDTGTPIKNIANRLGEYEYTYTEPGTYKAVFVLNNANYKDEDSRIITMLINVK